MTEFHIVEPHAAFMCKIIQKHNQKIKRTKQQNEDLTINANIKWMNINRKKNNWKWRLPSKSKWWYLTGYIYKIDRSTVEGRIQ